MCMHEQKKHVDGSVDERMIHVHYYFIVERLVFTTTGGPPPLSLSLSLSLSGSSSYSSFAISTLQSSTSGLPFLVSLP